MKIEIIYEDEDIIVIYKPAGFPTQTSQVGQADVVSELKSYLRQQRRIQAAREGLRNLDAIAKEVPYVGVVHRLDQPVEGLLVFAKNKQAAATLSRQLKKEDESALNKQYLAVVCGKPVPEEGKLVDYLVKNPNNTASVARSEDAMAKKAVLRYKNIRTCRMKDAFWDMDEDDVCAEQDLTMILVSIETGRFHQIRVQMSHAGYPLLGDQKYGSAQAKVCSNLLCLKNVALCAYSISLIHPTTGEPLYFEREPKGQVYTIFND